MSDLPDIADVAAASRQLGLAMDAPITTGVDVVALLSPAPAEVAR